MLVVSRKVGQRILIGNKIVVTVVKVGSGGVRIGIDAPTEMAVVREELAKQLRESEQRTIELSKDSLDPISQDPLGYSASPGTEPGEKSLDQ